MQPFTYLQMVFGAAIGVLVFEEVITLNIAMGAMIVSVAGLFTLWRAHISTNEDD